jgi:hypothetical protein
MIISYIVADMASHFTTSPRLYYHPPHVSILLLTNTVTFTTSARPELLPIAIPPMSILLIRSVLSYFSKLSYFLCCYVVIFLNSYQRKTVFAIWFLPAPWFS